MEDPGDESQPQGFYPRVNAKSLATGQYANMIVSVVGHFLPTPNADGTVPFKASDGAIVALNPDQIEMPMIGADSPPFEVIGQVLEQGTILVFVTRELTKDMDMDIYNGMLDVQTNPKFSSYFSQLPVGQTG